MPGADAGAKFVGNFARRLSSFFFFCDTERDRSNARMTAAAVAFANLSQIDGGLGRRPRIRAYRNFHAETALAEAHAVNRFRMQIVRHELVVALEVMVGDIKKEGLIFGLDTLFQHRDGALVTLKQWRQQRRDERLLKD